MSTARAGIGCGHGLTSRGWQPSELVLGPRTSGPRFCGLFSYGHKMVKRSSRRLAWLDAGRQEESVASVVYPCLFRKQTPAHARTQASSPGQVQGSGA